MAATIKQQLEAALKARGETLVSTGELDQWSRQYMGLRDLRGALCVAPIPKGIRFWFLGKAGALRVGGTRLSSVPANQAVRNTLLAEGIKILADGKRPKT